jgi:hypothetical protein
MENAALSTLRTNVLSYWPDAHWQRIENHYTPGTPDANVCIPGMGEFWVEGKFLKRWPSKPEAVIKIELRREQAMWANSRQRAGGNAIVALRIGSSEWLFFNANFLMLVDGLTQEGMRFIAYHQTTNLSDLEAIFTI